tara:strand:- start:1106 stop:2038 length:933 start_codon:yes stop_codon:yes gene_type:complete
MIFPNSHTLRSRNFGESDLLENEIVITAELPSEQRGEIEAWNNIDADKIILVKPEAKDEISALINRSNRVNINLRSTESIRSLLESAESLLIDITSLRHSIWAPLVKFCYEQNLNYRVLYVEPAKYQHHPSPSSDTFFDLTTKFEGMLPLPGFAKLDRDVQTGNDIFVTMLGFEGSRPRRLLTELEPEPKVIPIIGVSAFKIEYPTYTIACNRGMLTEYNIFSEIRHARASCPFEIYETLSQLRADFPDSYMYIAPVGTKPHALGAVIYHLANANSTELLYDHPIGKENRTKGKSQVHVYSMNKFPQHND